VLPLGATVARSWNVTGLYKASKDRMPAKRSRKLIGTPKQTRLVIPVPPPTCERCGFQVDTNAHAMFCGASSDWAGFSLWYVAEDEGEPDAATNTPFSEKP
jgi:hypothetical protein